MVVQQQVDYVHVKGGEGGMRYFCFEIYAKKSKKIPIFKNLIFLPDSV